MKLPKTRINHQIQAPLLRVITDGGENLGIIPRNEALAAAEERGLDLIEISPNAEPPVAKIMDYGKFQYEQKKKQKDAKAKSHATETKNVQVKIGTSEHDLGLKAKKISEWLREGHRVKIELFLSGRTKYTAMGFKEERLKRILNLIAEPYKTAEEIKPSPKGIALVIERAKK